MGLRDCVGDTVTVTEPKASFALPADAAWLLLVGDLTALPAIARILETGPGVPTYVLAEVPDDELLAGYLPGHADVTWLEPPAPTARARSPRSSRASTGPRATATSGWRGSRPRCARSAST